VYLRPIFSEVRLKRAAAECTPAVRALFSRVSSVGGTLLLSDLLRPRPSNISEVCRESC
jgi:hypothetical protein